MFASPRWSDSPSRWVDHQRQMHYDHLYRLDYWFPTSDRTTTIHDPDFYPPPIPRPTDEHIRRIVREEIADLLPIDVPD